MAAFAAGAYRSSPGRGTSPGFRFTLYAVLAIVLMFLDQRRGWLEQARYFLSGTAYPLQLAVSSPTAAWRWIEASLQTREELRAENAALRARERALEIQTLRFEALARENGELRGLRAALPPVADRWLVAEIVNVELDSLRQRVLINRGARNGVFKAQAVLDSHGLLGQTIHVGPWSAEVILITDPEHAVPVQIERTGVRTIAVGTGDPQSLALPYLPANADVKPGDLLVTSGLGGVFPQGYPVARVTEVRHDAVQPLAQIRARPLAQLDKLREVMLVWFRPDHPAAPSALARDGGEEGGLSTGNPAFQPQQVPGSATAAAAAAHPPTPAAGAAAARTHGARAPRPVPAPARAPVPTSHPAAHASPHPATPQAEPPP
ncbi:MAG TPA: rod shape-determining protein MreC [Steroidobacteraceae bacterium]|nr:rod shape-determining protein MreC [Steroidobacteraceae bacterium]